MDAPGIAGIVGASCAVLVVFGAAGNYAISSAKTWMELTIENAMLRARDVLKTELNGRYPQKIEVQLQFDAVSDRFDTLESGQTRHAVILEKQGRSIEDCTQAIQFLSSNLSKS